ncbi:MAG: hypothetical protein NZ929_06145 [Aigarchaeota archaeon]|nr:hypothetical protein [Aigarchaeota archaeon]MCX8192563.1 hypothetical protein [Nitrososphaeria archaeon]MDW7985701.1 hypothetical protein [Nitrososphaerota archaeon]
MSQYSEIREILSTLKEVDVDKVLSVVGDKIKIYPVSHYLSTHNEYIKELDQKENFCGAFTASYILRGMGYRIHKKERVDQDYIAYLSRVNVDPHDLAKIRRLKDEIAKLSKEEADEIIEKNRSIWYRFDDLPTTLKPQELGASPEGIIYAVHEVSMSNLRAIPVKTVSKIEGGLLTRDKMEVFLDLLKRSEEYGAQFILNLNTKYLLDSEKIVKLSEKLLLRESFQEVFRESVGHYVGCGGLIEVEGSFFIIIRETYRRYGVHIQPVEYVRRALIREDGREGGIIIIVPTEFEEDLRKILVNKGFRIEMWDNGSPFIPFTIQRTS